MLPLSLARLMLAPLLILQGRRVRRIALKLPEAAGDRSGCSRAAGERASGCPPATGLPDATAQAALRLLILGDSSAAGVGAPTQHLALSGQLLRTLHEQGIARIDWQLEARTGWTAADALAHLDTVTLIDADVTLCVLGVNDVTADAPVQRWLDALSRIDACLRATRPGMVTAWSGLPPMHRFPLLPQPLRWYLGERARRFDQALSVWCQDAPHRLHVPMPRVDASAQAREPLTAEDGFHPAPAACRLWAGQLAPALAAAWHRASVTTGPRAG